MHIKSKVVAITCIFLGLLVSGNSCTKFGLDDPTLDILDKAIEELRQQPERWEKTMINATQQLEKSGSKLSEQVAKDVRDTYNSILGQTGNEFSCRSDFVAERLQQRLQSIGYRLDSNRFAQPVVSPVICSTNPGNSITIDTQLISYYGFDFLEFKALKPFRAYLQYADGEEVEQVGIAAPSTNYQLNLDIQSPRVKEKMQELDRNRQPQIVIKWGEQTKEQSILPIILPKAKLPKRKYEVVGKIGPFGGHWGSWGNQVQCPTDQWVLGGELKVEPKQGRGDDTALNGIYLRCGTQGDRARTTEIASAAGPWGKKFELGTCKSGYVIGARLRIEPKQGSGDDTGGVDAQFWCEDETSLQTSYRLDWGGWSSRQSCPRQSAICGLKTRVESSQRRGDDTALNDAEFTCCSLP
ncbi:MAG: hypothetical protein F6K63_19140 [Moorea sp. SIO1G6]|uniref:hypothetical protein n=1 Tax=Moorena sp. SIO1G6 TaxID=2607840 RepID=UPI0013C24A2F|nr:hypothetical protein [Moorena sp. SIO1G6]NET66386.1 hypothetical protein [Moorena sp. SIO1G6]